MRYDLLQAFSLRTLWDFLPRPWALWLVLWGFSSGPSTLAADGLASEPSLRPTQWTITYDGKPVMVSVFDQQKFKPYVQALNTLNGYGVLKDSPEDHLHHHALMYGIKINGINFWEETAGCGVQKVVEAPPPDISRNATGLPQARLVQVLYWLAPEDAFLPNTNAPALLSERRTLTLTLDPGNRETALHWKSEFVVGSKTNTVTLTGANYHGLGMRFQRELDSLAVHFTPEGQPDLGGSRQDVSTHSWEAVTFNNPGKPATIALFSGPGNARGDSRYFAMKTPFAYVSATQGLDQEPMVYRRGDRFELNYLVTLYPELKTTQALAERARKWSASFR
jgi:hypothetical protein